MSGNLESPEGLRTRAARHQAIRDILESQEISSQEQLRAALATLGFATVQGTLSRDLGELGATKVRASTGAVVYQVVDDEGRAPSAVEPGPARLSKWCQELLVGAENAENLLVLRTPAGAASMLGAAVDSARLEGIVGTVAGDDTILTVCRSERDARTLKAQLLELAERHKAA